MHFGGTTHACGQRRRYYNDLALDVVVASEYYNKDKAFFAATVSVLAIHVVMQTVFDYLTMGYARDDASKWSRFRQNALLNVLHVRIIKEAWLAYSGYKDDGKKLVPRSAPASFAQVKLAEGLFEGLPQALLQTLLAVKDVLKDGDLSSLSLVRVASLTTSYLALAVALASMGQRVQGVWRATFFWFVLSQAVIRAVSLMYLAADHDDERVFWTYLGGSLFFTYFFNIVMQKKEHSFTNMISTFIAFVVPVDIGEFTVLKSSQPRAAPLPFFIVRQLEIAFLAVFFAVEVDDDAETAQVVDTAANDNVVSGDVIVTAVAANVTITSRDNAGLTIMVSNALWFTTICYVINAAVPYLEGEILNDGLKRLFTGNPLIMSCDKLVHYGVVEDRAIHGGLTAADAKPQAESSPRIAQKPGYSDGHAAERDLPVQRSSTRSSAHCPAALPPHSRLTASSETGGHRRAAPDAQAQLPGQASRGRQPSPCHPNSCGSMRCHLQNQRSMRSVRWMLVWLRVAASWLHLCRSCVSR